MKTLSDALAVEQKKPTALPVVSLVARQFGHPQKAGGSGGAAADGIQPGMFGWTRLYYTPGIGANYHGLTIPGDGSLNRIRIGTATVYHQRVADPSPSSDFGVAWTNIMTCATPIAISSYGGEVWVFGDNTLNQIQFNWSGDWGQTWSGAGPILGLNGCALAVAAAHKPGGEIAVCGCHTFPVSPTLWFGWRIGGGWNYWTMASPPRAEALAMYYDGDWNIIALVNNGGSYSIGRIVFGDGYRVTQYTFSPLVSLNTGRATVDAWELIQQYYDKPYKERWTVPVPPVKKTRMGKSDKRGAYRRFWEDMHPLAYQPFKLSEDWRAMSAIMAARALDNLGLDAPFIAKPSGAPPIMSCYKDGEEWFFRLRPATDFYDSDWNKAYKLAGSRTYGMALACSGDYIWGTRANEVWRSKLPGAAWTTPTAGSGPGGTTEAIPQGDILSFEESIHPMAPSTLTIILDNSKGTYDNLPTTHIKRGSRVELAVGYRTPADDTAPANNYFIENWTYDHAPNVSTVTLHCVDAWGLLEEYVIPGPQEFNLISNTHTVYAIINKLMQCIGGTLTWYSRSTDITTLYPKLEVQAGETGAGLLKRLLDLVPDVILFNGVIGYIVYPQVTDPSTSAYYFPGDI